jgi:hypothetical protein
MALCKHFFRQKGGLKRSRMLRHLMIGVGGLTLLATASPLTAQAVTAMSTEAFLNTLGVNTHIDPKQHWDTDPAKVGSHLAYIGVRNQCDWPYKAEEGADFLTVQSNWSPLGRLWTSIGEANQTNQRNDLSYAESIYTTYGSGLVYVLGGPNEEDDDYPQGLGATLPDSALVQGQLYTWAHSQGRNVKVNQMDFGAGWTAENNWQGDYNPSNTGITLTHPERGNQNYTPGGADIGSAHTYISNSSQTEFTVLNSMRANALLTTPGKPVAHTEAGIYKDNGKGLGVTYSTIVVGAMTVVGAFDSAAAGDAGYFVYGLQDDDVSHTYGFYDCTDTIANPIATYYHNMTTILASTSGTYGPGQPPTFTPGSLNVTYSNTTTAAHLLMQKPTGEYVIADWHEVLMDGTGRHRDESDRHDYVWPNLCDCKGLRR